MSLMGQPELQSTSKLAESAWTNELYPDPYKNREWREWQRANDERIRKELTRLRKKYNVRGPILIGDYRLVAFALKTNITLPE